MIHRKNKCIACGKCCGPMILCSPEEKANIQKYVQENSIQENNNPDRCKYFSEKGCSIYEVRPKVCRMFGEYNDPMLTCRRNTKYAVKPITQEDKEYKEHIKKYGVFL